MRSHKRLAIIALVLAFFLTAMPSTTPRVYGASSIAVPCSAKCTIAILSPGGPLNLNTNVNSSFIVSFAVNNFTLVQPGTVNDVNTTLPASGSTKSDSHGNIHLFGN